MHKIYEILSEPLILQEFVDLHKIKKNDLDFLYGKISSKNQYELRLIRSEENSLLLSFEMDYNIREVYQLTKEGKTFKLNIPSSILNYMNLIR